MEKRDTTGEIFLKVFWKELRVRGMGNVKILWAGWGEWCEWAGWGLNCGETANSHWNGAGLKALARGRPLGAEVGGWERDDGEGMAGMECPENGRRGGTRWYRGEWKKNVDGRGWGEWVSWV